MFIEIKTVSPYVRSQIDLASRGDTDFIINEINGGISQLWQGKKPLKGYIVTRLERVDNGSELVLVIGVGRGMRLAIKFLSEYCINNEIRSIRTHVVNRALVRIYKSLGFYISELRGDEYILKKEF